MKIRGRVRSRRRASVYHHAAAPHVHSGTRKHVGKNAALPCTHACTHVCVCVCARVCSHVVSGRNYRSPSVSASARISLLPRFIGSLGLFSALARARRACKSVKRQSERASKQAIDRSAAFAFVLVERGLREKCERRYYGVRLRWKFNVFTSVTKRPWRARAREYYGIL